MDPDPAQRRRPPPGGAGGAGPELAELLQRSARGDRAAFAALYDATAARVHGLALRVVRDPAQAEEVTQEAFLEIWRTASRYDVSRGSAAGVAADDRAPQGGRPSAERRGIQPTRVQTYHHRNQTVDHDTTAEASAASAVASWATAWFVLVVRRVPAAGRLGGTDPVDGLAVDDGQHPRDRAAPVRVEPGRPRQISRNASWATSSAWAGSRTTRTASPKTRAAVAS